MGATGVTQTKFILSREDGEESAEPSRDSPPREMPVAKNIERAPLTLRFAQGLGVRR